LRRSIVMVLSFLNQGMSMGRAADA